MLEEIRKAVFGRVTLRVDHVSERHNLAPAVNLIVMSRDSMMQLRSHGAIEIIPGEPDRIYGVRIARDDSLGFGQFLAATVWT